MTYTPRHPRQHQGFILLMSMVVVAAVGAAIATSLLLIGLGSSRTGFSIQQSAAAQSLSFGCAEEALQKIYDSVQGPTPPPAYTGTGSLTLGSGSCTYSVLDAGGTARTIETTGTVGSVVRKDKIQVTSENPIVISTWKEVPDF